MLLSLLFNIMLDNLGKEKNKIPLLPKKKIQIRKEEVGNFLAIQWIKLLPFTDEGAGSIPSRGTKIPQAKQYGQKKKKKGRCNLFFLFADNIIAYI